MPFFKAYPELRPNQVGASSKDKDKGDAQQAYDYIIIGGGTAGCVIASRLSEDPATSVLLIERGVVGDTWTSRVPLISSDTTAKSAPVYKWKTVPQREANGQELEIIAGKALGGTTRINSMLYTRGAPAEWNRLEQVGLKGWSYKDMLPYFLKSEKAADNIEGNHHGRDGPWLVRSIDQWSFPFWPHVLKAANALGLSTITDINDPSGPIAGAALIHRTQNSAGKRNAVSTAFLPKDLAISRSGNLKICTGTIVNKVDIQEIDGEKRAVGVYFQADTGGKDTVEDVYYARAKKEVIVSSGTFGSPQVLMLSGVGPEAHLKEHGIPVVENLPGVGQNLMDHIGTYLSWKVPLQDSLHALQASMLFAVTQFFKYLIFNTGLFLLPVAQVSMFIRSCLLSPTFHLTTSPPPSDANSTALPPDLDPHNPSNIPDLEIIPVPLNVNPETMFSTRHGVLSLLVILVQPESTGSVRLASSNARIQPIVDLGFFSASQDISILRKGLKFAFEVGKQLKASNWADMEPFEHPVAETSGESSTTANDDASLPSDDVLDTWIRKTAQTEFHYTSTCRMTATKAEGGVVDDELRVFGINGLRVADASVFPRILATHTQAPTVAVAEKCADLLKRGKD